MVLPGPELSLTCSLRREGYSPYAKRELESSNNRKPNRDESVFHCHGVYPATMFKNQLRIV